MLPWQFYFKLLGIDEYTLNYKDNLWISFILFDMALLFIALLFILLPLSCFQIILAKTKYNKILRITAITQLAIEVIYAFFLGVLIIFACIGEYVSFYLGMPVVWVVWMLCFVHINRDRQGLSRSTTPKLQQESSQNQEDELQLVEKEFNEREESELDTKALKSEKQESEVSSTRSSLLSYLKGKNTYLQGVLSGLKRRWFLGLAWGITSAVACTFIGLGTCRFCVSVLPVEPSSAMTRLLFQQGAVCKWDQICFSYFTVPEDMSTSLIVNYNLYSYEPLDKEAFVAFSTTPLDQAHAVVTRINATCFKVTTIVEQQRYQCWADMVDLKPNTTYYVQTYYRSRVTKELHGFREVLKVRTLPSVDDPGSDTIKFVAGGDLQLIQSKAGEQLSLFAAAQEPLFAVLGGDLAYENGYGHCYRRVDVFMTTWQRLMKTPTGYTVPILSCIGNHEASGFRQSRDTNSFYIKYFPHELNLHHLDPQNRTLYHYHKFSSHSAMVALDTAVHTEIKDQVAYLDHALGTRMANVRNKLAVYHMSLFPSRIGENTDIIEEMAQYWEPLFDKHELTVGFENHYHSFKQTYFIRNRTIVTDEEQASGAKKGTLYIGDGCWGQVPGHLTVNDPMFKKFARLPNILVVEASQTAVDIKAIAYALESECSTISEVKV